MENHIGNTDLINAYLDNKLSNNEKLAFEKRLETDSEFNQLYNEQLAIIEGINRVDLKVEINGAKQSYVRAKWIKYIGVSVGVILVSALVYNFVFETVISQVVEPRNNSEIVSDSVIVEKLSEAKIEKKIIAAKQSKSEFILNKTLEKREEISTSEKATSNDTTIKETVTKKVIVKELEPTAQELISFFKSVKKAPQIIEVNTEKEFIVTCKEGTKLTIPAKSFVDVKTGKLVRGKINLEVTEYYKLSDMLLGNLTTKSDDKQLETGGMLYLDANKKGNKLKLKSGRRIQMVFNNKGKKGMQLFSGEESREVVNWRLQNQTQDNTVSAKGILFNEVLEEDVTVSFSTIEEVPTYPGCENVSNNERRKCMSDNINNFVKRKFNVEIAESIGLTGRQKIYARFEIDKKGNIGKVDVRTSVKELGDETIRVLELVPQLIPGKQRGKPVKTIYDLVFSIELEGVTVRPSHTVIVKSDKQFIGELEKRMDSIKYGNGNFASFSTNDIQRYAFATTKLGWINCDRFARTTSKKVKYKLKIKNPDGTNVKMIFKSISSILPSSKRNDNFEFGWVPKEEEIVLIAIKCKNNKIYLGKKETNTTTVPDLDFDFKEVTIKELKSELEVLNSLFN